MILEYRCSATGRERESGAKVSHMDATNVIRPKAKTFVYAIYYYYIQCVYVRYEKYTTYSTTHILNYLYQYTFFIILKYRIYKTVLTYRYLEFGWTTGTRKLGSNTTGTRKSQLGYRYPVL